MHELELADVAVHVRLWSEDGPECEATWPVALPKSYEELFRGEYGTYIAKQVKQYNQVERNLDDLTQEICCKLIAGKLLDRFVAREVRMSPATLYAHEAADLMGVTFDEFQIALYHKPLVGLDFVPREGEMTLDHETGRGLVDHCAIFNSEDIRVLDMAYPNYNAKARTLPRRVTYPLQSLGFRAYLNQAIHNHFANWCRTRKRKYRDLLLPETSVMRYSSVTGCYAHITGTDFEETSDWESRVVSLAMHDEDMLTVVEAVELEFEAAGIDVQTLSETETYHDGARVRERPTARARQAIELLDAVGERRAVHPNPVYKPKAHWAQGHRVARHEATNFGDGRTIREAVKSQQRAELRAQIRARETE